MVNYLIGDIGGTNTRLVLYHFNEVCELDLQNDQPVCTAVETEVGAHTYSSPALSHLSEAIKKFMEETKVVPMVAALAVAGPVTNNKAFLTNLGWHLDGDEMAKELGIAKVLLVNDFSGVAFGILDLTADDVECLNDMPCVPRAPIACVGAGTGLGEAYLTHNGKEYDVWPSEGGHCDFSPRNALQMKMVEWIYKKVINKTEQDKKLVEKTAIDGYFRVSVERVVSGSGLPNVYGFLAEEFPDKVSEKVTQEMKEGSVGRVISTHAVNGTDELCVMAMGIFVDAYGSEAGEIALKTLPLGGLYIAGGIASKILPLLKKDNRFVTHMMSKGRLKPVLERVPVYVIKGSVEVGLMGARVLARRLLKSMDPMKHSHLPDHPAPPNRKIDGSDVDTHYALPRNIMTKRRSISM